MDYYIERISKKNFHLFLEVFKATFNQNINEDYFVNKFKTDYTGYTFLGYIAIHKKSKDPAAYYGVFPTLVKENGKSFVAAISGDTATHPNHRKKGLFRTLHNKTMQLCSEEKISFIFGFPNQNSYPGFVKFGWSDSVTAKNLKRIIKVRLTVKFLRKFLPFIFKRYQKKLIVNNQISIQEFKDYNYNDSLVKKSSKNILIPREPDYIKYKLRMNSKIIKLKNGLIWVSFKGNQMHIGDLFGSEHQDVLEDAIAFAQRSGFDVLIFKTANEDLINFFIEKGGFQIHNTFKLITNCLNKKISDYDFTFTGGDVDTF